MRRTSVFVIAFLASAVLSSTPAELCAQQVSLRWKYEPGSQLVYRMTNVQEATLPLGQGSTSTEQEQTLRWTVDSVAPNGDATVTVATEAVRVSQIGPGGSLEYDSEATDSAGAATDPGAAMFAGLVGATYTLVIEPTGRVKEVQGLDGMIEGLLDAVPPESRAMGEGMFEEMFSEESITDMMQQSVQTFPDAPVGPSESWENTFSMPVPMMGEITTTAVYTLDGVEERDGRTVALISSTGTVVLGEAEGMLAGMMEIDESRITSTMVFDIDRGITLSGTSRTTMSMTVSAGSQAMTVGTVNRNSIDLIEYVPGERRGPPPTPPTVP